MAKQGIYSTDSRPLNPHITIMNMDKADDKFRHTVAKHIDPSLYEKFKSSKFGCQTVRSIQLCLMDKPRAETGYYRLAHEVYLDSTPSLAERASRVLACSSFGADHQAASRTAGEEEVLSTRELAWGGKE
ncbi:A-kinase anchor protein 7-like [Haliotis asinina]|uniref:A-kinase anchor protein 7-like n=1 Tax=Haliotis asinina TaxID=109174 RepID=UPI003531CF5F